MRRKDIPERFASRPLVGMHAFAFFIIQCGYWEQLKDFDCLTGLWKGTMFSCKGSTMSPSMVMLTWHHWHGGMVAWGVSLGAWWVHRKEYQDSLVILEMKSGMAAQVSQICPLCWWLYLSVYMEELMCWISVHEDKLPISHQKDTPT